MVESVKLSVKQRLFLAEVFDEGLDEDAAMARHQISRDLYNRWLLEPRFGAALDARIAGAHSKAEILLASYATAAAGRLIALTGSKNAETARKACLDIISRRPSGSLRRPAPGAGEQLSAQKAGKLLEALAEDAEKPDEQPCRLISLTGCNNAGETPEQIP